MLFALILTKELDHILNYGLSYNNITEMCNFKISNRLYKSNTLNIIIIKIYLTNILKCLF